MITSSNLATPNQNEYDTYYHQYISKVPNGDFLEVYVGQASMLQDLFGGLSDDELNRLHEPYTWTLKQVLGHLIDVERVFSTRMLRIGVGDETAIPGIDQNIYVDGLDYKSVLIQSLLDEFAALRNANVLLVQRMSEESLSRIGMASEKPVSARANLYILCGHVEYHAEIVRKRLGIL